MAIGKSKRFAIFMRDGFTCQYCGRRPPDVVLEVDHMVAVATGGSDEDLNLITSCWDCNRGKRDKVLSGPQPRPDADLEFLKVQQEIVEARRYLDAKSERDKMDRKVRKALESIWVAYISEQGPSEIQWKAWMARFSPDEIEYAIKNAAPKYASRNMTVYDCIRYVSGILNSVRKQQGEQE